MCIYLFGQTWLIMVLTQIRSTTLGSITMAPRFALFPVPAYKVSKAALNMLTVQYAQSFADQGFTFLAISPGVRFLSVFLDAFM